ncbi:MAG: DNA-processing protein DprA [Candidatus Symbiobacter sp.]|nr:DNA-processing protein DprA [Candidatus Symbiobacter sp.]
MNHISIKFNHKNIGNVPTGLTRFVPSDSLYPKRVKERLGKNAPEHLDMVGNQNLLQLPGIGFCGSRKSSEIGLRTALDCAVQAAQMDVAVIGGNAVGVDFEAHYNCLKAGGKTILVLPEGINHFTIKKDLKSVWDWERVLVMSQFDPNERWMTYRAMARNNLIIALSQVMIVIEAGETGGTLDAGMKTLKYGLPLYVAQYEDMSLDARGNQILIDRGAYKLGKNKRTNKANLTRVFESLQGQGFYQAEPMPGPLFS